MKIKLFYKNIMQSKHIIFLAIILFSQIERLEGSGGFRADLKPKTVENIHKI